MIDAGYIADYQHDTRALSVPMSQCEAWSLADGAGRIFSNGEFNYGHGGVLVDDNAIPFHRLAGIRYEWPEQCHGHRAAIIDGVYWPTT